MVSSLFDRISTCRIARPSLDARSGTNVVGLIPHFYRGIGFPWKNIRWCVSMPSRAYTSFLREEMLNRIYYKDECVNALSGLYLISTKYQYKTGGMTLERVNALSGLYLISTVPLQKPRFYAVSRACFCRYLSEYSDNSRFSCMLTFWTYLMRCTYP